jgi:hypothetical protein
MKYGLTLVWICLLSAVLGAQTTGTAPDSTRNIDLLVLKNGKELRGKVERYEVGKPILLRQYEGLKEIPFEEVDKVALGMTPAEMANFRRPGKPALQKGKTYSQFAIGIPMGAQLTGRTSMGFNLEASMGIQLREQFGVGLGTGLNFFFGEIDSRLVPIYGELRLYNRASARNRVYFMSDMGWALGWLPGVDPALGTQLLGGYRFHPAFGVLWNTSATTRLNTEFGYLLQNARVREGFFENSSWRREEHYTIQRWMLKIGFLF